MKRIARFVMTGILVLTAGAYILLCQKVDTAHILSETTVNDVDVSGMTPEEALSAVEQDAAARCGAAVLTVHVNGNQYNLDVRDVLEIDASSAVEEAVQKSQVAFPIRGLAWLKARFIGNHITEPPTVKDYNAYHNIVINSGLLENNDSLKKPWRIENQQLVFTAGEVGKKIDEDGLKEAVLAAVQKGDFESVIECPLVPLKSEVIDIDQIYEEVHADMANASLDPSNDYEITASVTGVDFDKEAARSALENAKKGTEVRIDLVYTEPTVTTKMLQENLFADTLATYRTKVSGSANRLTNVKLAAQKCDGIILRSGDEFSFNNAVGEQTEATGFKPADAIQYGKIIQAYGGGTCQVSSTIFAAALYANLEIVERWNHYFVPKYIPAGVDAAVAWGDLDLRIADDTDYPVRLDVKYQNGYVTVSIQGTKTDDSSVEIKTEEVESPSEDMLAVQTYRSVSNGGQVFMDKVAYSEYKK